MDAHRKPKTDRNKKYLNKALYLNGALDERKRVEQNKKTNKKNYKGKGPPKKRSFTRKRRGWTQASAALTPPKPKGAGRMEVKKIDHGHRTRLKTGTLPTKPVV